MWSDNETDRDFLNFRYVADIAAEVIAQANGRPLSLGIAGSWGVGKSSLMKLLACSLRERQGVKFLFVEFNAWLYQGYDDTRAALMEIIATAILQYAEENKTVVEATVEKARSLLSRVNWFRFATVGATTAASLALGLPPVGLIGEGVKLVKELTEGNITHAELNEGEHLTKEVAHDAKSLIKDKPKNPPQSPPKAIHAFRDDLAATIEALDVTLVVLIDDLDRCLPPTAISTLEAMRLFLFLDRTAFIVAADDKMIREAVRSHFGSAQLDDDLVTNYFDKLIQVPIRVPPLGTQDVRAYLMMLFIENSSLSKEIRDKIRSELCQRLGETWQNKRVDRSFVATLIDNCPAELALQLDLADRIAPILTTSPKIAGNPRLIKRFLNTLSIRLSIAKAQSISLDEAALAKMLLFERCGTERCYAELLTSINESGDGRADFLAKWEEAAPKGSQALTLEGEWNSDFVRGWLTLQPPLADVDLRGVVYVSREHLPIITAADRLSSDGAALLEALLKLSTQPSAALSTKLKALLPVELDLITDRLLSRARAVNQWGTPTILWGLLTVATIQGEHTQLIVRFLAGLPSGQLTAAIVPLLADKPWAATVLTQWASASGVSEPVKKAILSASKKVVK